MGDVEDIEDDKDEIDQVYTAGDGLWGIDGLDTVLYQSALSPDGLFQSVGRTSSSMLYAFECFRDLCRQSEVQLETDFIAQTYQGSERLELVVHFRPCKT